VRAQDSAIVTTPSPKLSGRLDPSHKDELDLSLQREGLWRTRQDGSNAEIMVHQEQQLED